MSACSYTACTTRNMQIVDINRYYHRPQSLRPDAVLTINNRKRGIIQGAVGAAIRARVFRCVCVCVELILAKLYDVSIPIRKATDNESWNV